MDGNVDGNADDINEGGKEAKKRKKLHKSRRRDQALFSSRVIISADRVGACGHNSARQALCLCAPIAPKG